MRIRKEGDMEGLIYTPGEVATILKLRVATVYELLEAGEIPAFRVGENWKVPKKLLTAYIEDRAIRETKERRKTHEEVEASA